MVLLGTAGLKRRFAPETSFNPLTVGHLSTSSNESASSRLQSAFSCPTFMSRTLLSRIKSSSRYSRPSYPPATRRLLQFADVTSEIIRSENPRWEELLEDHFSQYPDISVSDVLHRIQDDGICLKLFNWASRCSQVARADSPGYSSLLKILARSRKFSEIDMLLNTMAKEGMTPSRGALDALIISFSYSGLIKKALDLYSRGKETAHALPDTYTCNALLNALVKSRRMDTALKVYEEMLQQDAGDNFSTCILVKGLCKVGKVDEGQKLIEDRWGVGCIPNVVFYNTLINGYCIKGAVWKAYKFFENMKLQGFVPTLVSYGTIINGFCKEGNFKVIDRLLAEMKSRGLDLNVYIYNNLIDATCKHCSLSEGMETFRRMVQSGCNPDIGTYNTLISCSCREGKLQEADEILKEVMRKGLIPNRFTYTPLVHGYYKEGETVRATNLLIEMIERGNMPDLVTYGTLVHGLVSVGEVDEAMSVRKKMKERGVHPDAAIYNVLMSGLCKKGRFQVAKELLSEMLDDGVIPDEFVYVTMMDGFIRCGNFTDAKKIFDFMEAKDIKPGVAGYNAMIKGYCKCGMMGSAISCLDKMIKDRISPDEFTYTTIIDGYVKQNDMEQAIKIFNNMKERKCNPNTVTYSALINGFSQKGDFDRAEELLGEMQSRGLLPNAVTYTCLIKGFVKGGKLEKVALFFEQMLLNNCSPTNLTYLVLIDGLMDNLHYIREWQGDCKFILLVMSKSMIMDGCEPRLAAYNSIITCLCRHRMLEAAVKLRDKMVTHGCVPDSVTSISLLHGLSLDGKSSEWSRFLSLDFDKQQLQIAWKYSRLLDQYLYQGTVSEASGMLQHCIEERKSELERSSREMQSLEVSEI